MPISTRRLSGGRVLMRSPFHARPEALIGALLQRYGARLAVAVGRKQCTAALPSRFRLSYARGQLLLTLDQDASPRTQELDIQAIEEALDAQLPTVRRVA